MSDVIKRDESIHEPTTAHIHPVETIPQGTQADGVLKGHEKRDVDMGGLKTVAFWITLVVVLSYLVVWVLMDWFLKTAAQKDRVPSATYTERSPLSSAWPDTRIETPLEAPDESPNIQPDPEKPLLVLREDEEERLSTYNWIKDEQGRTVGVSMPIERAMELTLERGLPTDKRANPRVEPPSGDPIAMGEIPVSERVLRGEQLKTKRATQPTNEVRDIPQDRQGADRQ